jgi:hypothetical protein
VRIELDGEQYDIVVPESTLRLSFQVFGPEARKAVRSWVREAFSPADAEHVLARLDDHADDLDDYVIMALANKISMRSVMYLVSRETERP